MTIEEIKTTEDIIDVALEVYDQACKDKDQHRMEQAMEVINYELAKLDNNEVVLITLPN